MPGPWHDWHRLRSQQRVLHNLISLNPRNEVKLASSASIEARSMYGLHTFDRPTWGTDEEHKLEAVEFALELLHWETKREAAHKGAVAAKAPKNSSLWNFFWKQPTPPPPQLDDDAIKEVNEEIQTKIDYYTDAIQRTGRQDLVRGLTKETLLAFKAGFICDRNEAVQYGEANRDNS